MRSGQRKRKVVVERLTSARGTYGEQTETWATLASHFANIKPMQGTETVQGGKIDPKVTHLFTFRKADITPADRITVDGRVFNISRVLNDESRGTDQLVTAIENV